MTRRINIVADKALLAAFADNTHNVTVKHVRAAVQDSEFSGKASVGSQPRWLRPAVGFSALAQSVIGALSGYQYWPAATGGARARAAHAVARYHAAPEPQPMSADSTAVKPAAA